MKKMTDQEWYSADEQAWNAAADKLEADGYTRRHDAYWPAVFVKGNDEQVLTRPLATLNWAPRPL